MMENIRKVTDHIRRRVAAAGGDPRREAMTVVVTRDGKLYHVDAQGEYWAVSTTSATASCSGTRRCAATPQAA